MYLPAFSSRRPAPFGVELPVQSIGFYAKQRMTARLRVRYKRMLRAAGVNVDSEISNAALVSVCKRVLF